MAQRTVYFYQMEIFKNIAQNEEGKQKYLDRKRIKDIYNLILDEKNLTNSCLVIKRTPRQQTLEVIDFNDEYLFARLGKTKNDTAVHLRDRIDLKPAEIEKEDNQDIEIYTYFLLNFKTGIVTFINTLSAPSITVLNDLITQFVSQKNIGTEILPILTKDVVDIIKGKGVISNIQFSVALPSDEVLGYKEIGLNEKEFDKIHTGNLKKQEVSVKLISNRNRSIFENLPAQKIKEFISSVFNTSRGHISKCKIKAKDHGEKLDEYDILRNKITKKATFKYDNNEGILNKLKEIYISKEDELLKYTRPNIAD
ncbi:hypothetical protein [Orenia marismortui]|uniref:hypothetical protein n=1 Tax=Orenia marismortui TaxID=46469 RepID=UPI00035E9748|nr:hypothetical protein [Orenia marismortui]